MRATPKTELMEPNSSPSALPLHFKSKDGNEEMA